MEGNLSRLLILKVLLTQVFANLSPYVQYQTVQNKPTQSGLTSLPIKPTCSYNSASYQPYSTTNQFITAIPKSTAVAPASQKTKTSKCGSKPSLDPRVLNNLAIALQLLIVSNMLNVDEESEVLENLLPDLNIPSYIYEALPALSTGTYNPSQVKAKSSTPTCQYVDTKYTATVSSQDKSYCPKNKYEPQPSNAASLPNASFLGGSCFEDTILQAPLGLPGTYGSPYASSRSNPRSSMTLMSPYEALGPSNPFSDPMNPYDSGMGSFMDFKSPYASILADDPVNNLFKMDLF